VNKILKLVYEQALQKWNKIADSEKTLFQKKKMA